MFSLACNLTKNDAEFLPVVISLKKVRENNSDFSAIEISLKKVSGNKVDFWPEKLHPKKYVEKTLIFRAAKLLQEKYVETTWVFRPAKLHQKKNVERTWIFWPSKLRRKKDVETTWIFFQQSYIKKIRGNSLKFSLRFIDLMSMWNWRQFDVMCPLDIFITDFDSLITNRKIVQKYFNLNLLMPLIVTSFKTFPKHNNYGVISESFALSR